MATRADKAAINPLGSAGPKPGTCQQQLVQANGGDAFLSSERCEPLELDL